MKRRHGLLLACLLVGCSDSDRPPNLLADNNQHLPPSHSDEADHADEADHRPDIILVVADDMRWDLMSAEGHTHLNTPNLDALAETGALMHKAFVPVALCSPSRAAILTGRLPHQASAPGIVWRNNSFLETQQTFAENLQAAGYTTAYIGKWHLGDGAIPKKGFDYWESFDWLGDFNDPLVYVNGKKRQFRGYTDDVLAARADLFLHKQQDERKPLFLMVGLKAPHLHFEHPQRHEHAFDGVGISKPDTYHEDFALSGKLKEVRQWLGMESFHCGLSCFNNNWDTYIKKHYRAILGLDDSIATIRSAMRYRSKQDNTLFIYTSDNGYSLGDHGLTEKHMIYEEPIRVPFLIDFPGDTDKGWRFDGLVSTLDIAPTALDYAEVTIPQHMTGRSLKALLDARTEPDNSANEPPWREALFLSYDDWQVGLRTDRFKYIESLKQPGHIELYDLQIDPKEKRSVHSDLEYAATLETLKRQLQSMKAENGWTEKTQLSVNRLLVSSPIPVADAHRVASLVSVTGTSEPGRVDVNGLVWKTVNRTDGEFLLGGAIPEGSSVLIAIPIRRISAWDPHIKVLIDTEYPTAMYVNGRSLWDNYEHRPIDYPNPPLLKETTLMVMRIDGEGELAINMGIEVAARTIQLPLED